MQGGLDGMMPLMWGRKILVSLARRARSAAIDVLARFFRPYLPFSSYPNSAQKKTKSKPCTNTYWHAHGAVCGEHASGWIAYTARAPSRASVVLANPAQSQY